MEKRDKMEVGRKKIIFLINVITFQLTSHHLRGFEILVINITRIKS